jgi:selenocysteine lyase/cysteine desulfurase
MGRSKSLRRTELASFTRERFPNKPAGAYLDNASIGLVPKDVFDAIASCYAALGSGVCGSAQWRPVVERARRELASECGVAEDEISFMASAGEALNAIAHAIQWQSGDEVLVLSGEFPTVTLPWLNLGADVRIVEVEPLPGDDRLGALLAAIGPRTRVVAVSHVNSFTGTLVDLDLLGRACAEADVILVCDGSQSAGAVPLDLRNVDFFVATGYKWLLAGFGIALVVCKRASLAQLRPTLLGHGNQTQTPVLTYGHINLAGVYALDAAAELRRNIGLQAIYTRIAKLARRIYDEITELGFIAAAAPERSAGIISLKEALDVPGVVAQLAATGIIVAERGGYVRISPNFYTLDSEIDLLLHALNNIGPSPRSSASRRHLA